MAKDNLMKDDGAGKAVPELKVTRHKAATTSFEDNIEIKGPRPWLDVRAFGAKGDGTDDTTAITQAMAVLPPEGGLLFFPAGTYVIKDQPNGILIGGSNVVFRGAGRRQTILRAAGTTQHIFLSSSPRQHIAIEDMALDGGNVVITCLGFRGGHVQDVRVSRCRFYNFDSGYGINAPDTADAVVEDCLFESLNPPGGHAIQFSSGVENLLVDRCVFRYCRDGLVIAAGGDGSPSNLTLASGVTVGSASSKGGGGCYRCDASPAACTPVRPDLRIQV